MEIAGGFEMITLDHDDKRIYVEDDWNGATLVLTRDEAIELRDKLAGELQKMPVPSERKAG